MFFVQINHTGKGFLFLIFREIKLRKYSSLHKLFYDFQNFDPNFISVYDKKQKQIYSFNQEEFDDLDNTETSLEEIPEWERDSYQLYHEFQSDFSGQRFIVLPSQDNLEENRVIYNYCFQLKDRQMGDFLLDSFNGSHAFYKFKNAPYQNHLLEDYEKYKYQTEKELATKWCKEHHLI